MAKKRKSTETPPRQEVFRNEAFSKLRGVVALPAVEAAPKPVVTAVPQKQAQADDELFLNAMEDVRPLHEQGTAKPKEKVKQQTAVLVDKTEHKSVLNQADRETFAKAINQLKLDVTFSDRFPESDEVRSLGANRLRQLKKGVITVNRELDLHGLTREEALDELPRFLRSAAAHGEKAVLVITGKGLNSPGEPVLQQAVAGWLRENGKNLIAEFAPAPRDMGGNGAFVVFLKN